MKNSIKTISEITPGIILSVFVAVNGIILSNFLRSYVKISAIILAILFGMLFRNILGIPKNIIPGMKFSQQKILKIAIIFLGFKLSLEEVYSVGIKGLTVVVVVLIATLLFTTLLGKRFNLSKELSVLVASGTGICGAAAIITIGSVTNAKDRNIALAIAIITIFGTAAMFLYPLIKTLFHLSDMVYGVWVGSSIQGSGQAVAAGFAVNNTSGAIATIVKLTRMLFLAPLAIMLGILFARDDNGNFNFRSVPVPYFIFGFIAMIFINSFGIIPITISKYVIQIDNFLLTVAMGAIGLNTGFHYMRQTGAKLFYVGFIAWIFIAAISYVIIWILF